MKNEERVFVPPILIMLCPYGCHTSSDGHHESHLPSYRLLCVAVETNKLPQPALWLVNHCESLHCTLSFPEWPQSSVTFKSGLLAWEYMAKCLPRVCETLSLITIPQHTQSELPYPGDVSDLLSMFPREGGQTQMSYESGVGLVLSPKAGAVLMTCRHFDTGRGIGKGIF